MHNIVYYTITSITAIAILSIVLYNVIRHRRHFSNGQKSCIALIISLIAAIIFDELMWVVDGQSFRYGREVNYFVTFMYYVCQCLPPLFWILYVADRYLDKDVQTNIKIIVWVPISIVIVFCVVSLFNGCVFYIDQANNYHRGNMVLVVLSIVFTYVIASSSIAINVRKRMSRSELYSYLFFPIIPFICVIIQLFFFGINIFLIGMTISVLLIFIAAMNEAVQLDFLTGLNNRRQLQEYISWNLMKARGKSRKKYVVGIMLDLIKFKLINDTYGHAVGDQALEDASLIIRQSFTKDDFISRYAGDEFVAIVTTDNRNQIDEIKRTIQFNENYFNETSKKPYKLNFSIGIITFDFDNTLNPQEFLERIDKAMYEDKKNRKIQSTVEQ